jgi:hypothetical protein
VKVFNARSQILLHCKASFAFFIRLSLRPKRQTLLLDDREGGRRSTRRAGEKNENKRAKVGTLELNVLGMPEV